MGLQRRVRHDRPRWVNSPTASVGVGTASLLGGITATFASGITGGGSSDPITTSPPNYGWNTTSYADQGNESGQRGVRFDVSTVGFNDVVVTFDTRHSNTASRWLRFDYTVDGGTSWVLGSASAGSVFGATNGGDQWYNVRTVDLTSVAAVNNNSAFGFRIVTVFGPQSGMFDDNETYTSYAAATGTSTYGASGTLRYDMVTVNAVPEPA